MRRAARIILAWLLLAAPALTLASQEQEAVNTACGAGEATARCLCQAGPEAQGPDGCCCSGGDPCQVNAAPPFAQDESLLSQARQPHPPAMAASGPDGGGVAWSPRPLDADESPWRPPKPLYLRHASLLL